MSKLPPITPQSVEAPSWFFMWIVGRQYITTICGWTRKQVQDEVARSNGMTWKEAYRAGGRVIRCTVRPR